MNWIKLSFGGILQVAYVTLIYHKSLWSFPWHPISRLYIFIAVQMTVSMNREPNEVQKASTGQ